MKKKWREPCVLFLEDAFSASDAARLIEAGYCQVERFAQHFPDEARGVQQSVKDPAIIRLCHKNTWMLVTLDSNMQFTHVEEIKRNPRSCILATAHNKVDDMEEWVQALIDGRAEFERYWKKHERPCFATFNRQGHIATHKTIGPEAKTRRNRPREADQAQAEART